MDQTTKTVTDAVKFEVTARVTLADLFNADQVVQVEDFLDDCRSGDDGSAYAVVDREEFDKAVAEAADEELPPTVQVTLGMVVEHCRNNAAMVIHFL